MTTAADKIRLALEHLKTARAALAYVPFKEAAVNKAMNAAAFHIDEALELLARCPVPNPSDKEQP